MSYHQFIKSKKSKSTLCCAILLSLGMLSSSNIIADQLEQNERKKPTGQYDKYTSANNNIMLNGFFVDSLLGLAKSGLGAAAGAGFNYLMRENGLDPTYNKLLQIVNMLESIQNDLDIILENQKVLKTFISDSFYNLHMANYVNALTHAYNALVFDQGKKQNLRSYLLGSETGEGLRQIERLYQLFFKDNVEQGKKDFSSDDLIVYVERNLVNKTNSVTITQENIDTIQSVKNTMLYKLRADYLPTEIQKNVLVAALNNDISIDIAKSIRLINNQVSSVGLAYASFLQKAVMVSQVLAILKEKDQKYAHYYLGDIYENKSLTEGLEAERIDSEEKIAEFLNYIKPLYITDTAEIIKNITNMNVTASTLGKVGTMAEAKKYCEIISFVPDSSTMAIDCASVEPLTREDYKFRFAASLGPLYTNNHVSPNIVNFTYGDNVSEDKRFTFNYNNPIKDRDTAKKYFSVGKDYTPFIEENPLGASFFDPKKNYLGSNISIYPVISENKCTEIRPLPYAPPIGQSCVFKNDMLVHFKNTGNFVYIKSDGASSPFSQQYNFYIGTTDEDKTRLKQTLLPAPAYNNISIQQAFTNGAVLQIDQDRTFFNLFVSLSVHAYNPLHIETNLKKGEKVIVSLHGNWLQYCDRAASTVIPVSKNGTAGWELKSLCHSNIDKANDFANSSVFIDKELITGGREVLVINYLPAEKTLYIAE